MPVPSFWTEWAAAGSLLTVIFFVLLALVKNGLRPTFASREELAGVAARLTALEGTLATLPSKDDLRVVQARLSSLDHALASLETRSGRVEEGVKSVQHMTQLLLEQHLRGEAHEPR